ncbi:hypothetical protein D9619_008835 [Psilocybe cf. subviscida]|uniref:Aminoglycoside phosphotransferase domain-containing protein n=1 Tax=Psilocybe cf. subviscida TaxID=2480587 RepID=A0A8H5BAK0_9AGAR|nr:hypothetical protein D9619_008835 [Psilocybe cf. subviscida]
MAGSSLREFLCLSLDHGTSADAGPSSHFLVVTSWSRASETPVGAEFIVMDFADGIALAAIWEILTMDQKISLVYEWFKFERRVIHAFSKSGFESLYLRDDLPADIAGGIFLADSDRPDEDYEDKYGAPEDINLDLGPWSDIPSYLKSLTNSEKAWIRKYAKRPTRMYVAPWGLPIHLQIPEEHLRFLDLYDKAAQYFIPTDERLLRPTMPLLDSNAYNIFLSREAFLRDGTIEIATVIDWQHTTILPLYLTTVFPTFIEDSIANDGQDEAEFLKEKNYLRKTYHALYFETGVDIAWASALSFDIPTPAARVLPLSAQVCWHAGYADLKKDLIRAALDWQNVVPDTECPIAAEGFTQQDLAQAREDQIMSHNARITREEIELRVGLNNNGAVQHDHYDSAVQTNRQLFDAWKASLDTKKIRTMLTLPISGLLGKTLFEEDDLPQISPSMMVATRIRAWWLIYVDTIT